MFGDNRLDRETTDIKLRKVHNIALANAVETKVKDTVADCWPDEEDMHEHYSSKLSIPILNDYVGHYVIPCKQACVLFEFIKCGSEEFNFTQSTTGELIDVATKKKPTAPERNRITYHDNIYADPDLMISNLIAEECFSKKCLPSS